jgi:hypothetical protein
LEISGRISTDTGVLTFMVNMELCGTVISSYWFLINGIFREFFKGHTIEINTK